MGNTKNSFDQLFDQLNRMSIGFEPMFRHFENDFGSGYPPYSITKNDNEFTLEIAIAGFKKDEIEISENVDTLIVSGRKNKVPASNILYQGIAARSFTRQFKLANNVKVKDAKLEDGILTIVLYEETLTVKTKSIPIK